MNFQQDYLRTLGEVNTPTTASFPWGYKDTSFSRHFTHPPEEPERDASDTGEGTPLQIEWDSEMMGDECLPLGWEDESVDDNGDTHWNPSWKDND
jgi:hypothetical protein